MSQRCGARFYPANGETVTPCELPVGHDDQHQGWCLGSCARWSGGAEEHEEYVSGWEDTPRAETRCQYDAGEGPCLVHPCVCPARPCPACAPAVGEDTF